MISAFRENIYLLLILVTNDFRKKYLGSILGFVWAVINPLVLICVYSVVFSSIVVPGGSTSGKTLNYGLYIFSGMLPWMVIQESVQRGSTVFHDNAPIIRHHVIPLFFLPLQVVLSAAFSSFLATMTFVVVKGVVLKSITAYCILLIFILPIHVLFCFGLSLVISNITVLLSDTAHFAMVGLFVWFFASPIIYPLDSIPPYLQQIMWLNPMTSIVQVYRAVLLFDRFPALSDLFSFFLFSSLVFAAGYVLYRNTHKEIVDRI